MTDRDARIEAAAAEIERWLRKELESLRRSIGQRFRRAREGGV